MDVYVKLPDSRESLYSSLGVKLHGYLFSHIPKELAGWFHARDIVPFSACLCEGGEGVALYRVCALNDVAECLLEPLADVEKIPVYGLKEPLAVLNRTEYHRQALLSLQEKPPLKEFDLILASPATYKKGGQYSNWFDLRSLLRTAAQKLDKFEGVPLDYRVIDRMATGMELLSYRFESGEYSLAGTPIPCVIGGGRFRLHGDEALIRQASLLLRYAEYAGIGTKTPMGMGGMLLKE